MKKSSLFKYFFWRVPLYFNNYSWIKIVSKLHTEEESMATGTPLFSKSYFSLYLGKIKQRFVPQTLLLLVYHSHPFFCLLL